MDLVSTFGNVALTCLTTLTVTFIFNAQVRKANNQSSKAIARDQALRSLLRVQLIEYHDKYVERGEIPSYALDNYEDMFGAYVGLGGNGLIKQMHEEIHELKISIKK